MIHIPPPKRFEPLGFVGLIVGLYWLLAPSSWGALLWALLPGSLLMGSGALLVGMPGHPRGSSYLGFSAVVSAVCAVLLVLSHPLIALLALAGSGLCLIVAGRVGLRSEVRYTDAPEPEAGWMMELKSAFDEMVLGYFLISAKLPSGAEAQRTVEQSFRLEAALRERGYDQDPSGLHPAPPAPTDVEISARRDAGFEYELLRWDSGYAPADDLPGARQWRSYTRNQRCAVRVLRHVGAPRPWLLCVHGYRMGSPLLDLSLFDPRWLHQRLGLNIIQPVLPLHGERSIGRRSGDGFLDGDLADLIFAEAQTLWDLRRTLAWLRQQEEQPRIGVYGVSLGGYNASLLAGYDADLDFVVAGIPLVDVASALYRVMPPAHLRYFAAQGLDEARYRRILQPVSPLARPAAIASDRRHIFAATGDRLVLPSNPLQLAQHWGVAVNWYQGSHLSLRSEPVVRETLREAMLHADWPLSR